MKRQTRPKLTIICAWCDDKEKLTKQREKKWYKVSHWICSECTKKYFN